jgi:hypothetical protein
MGFLFDMFLVTLGVLARGFRALADIYPRRSWICPEDGFLDLLVFYQQRP